MPNSNADSILFIELENCESTQDEVLKYLHANPQDMCVAVLARAQSHGRGRQERSWQSCEGNLFLSLGFRKAREEAQRPWPFVSLLAGVACARVLHALGAWDEACFLKWPNDLFRRTPAGFAKWGGILCEFKSEILIVGIGINLSSAPELGTQNDYTSTCAADFALTLPSPKSVAQVLAKEFKTLLEGWLQDPETVSKLLLNELSEKWMKAFYGLKGEVAGQGRVTALRLESDGRLWVQQEEAPHTSFLLSSGEFRTIFAPRVSKF
jgi:biotin-[acetyl-CoA-carboxylase] ligase BirA-like protein